MNKKKLKKKTQKKPKHIYLYLLLLSNIIAIPLIYTEKTIDPNLAPRLLFWGINLLVLYSLISLSSLFKGSIVSYSKLLIFPVYIIYFLLSILSLTQAINPSEGFFDITKTFLSLMLLYISFQIFTQYEDFMQTLVKTVVLSSIIAIALGLYQYIDLISGKTDYKLFQSLYRVKGLMAHKNQFAISVYLMLPFSIYGAHRLKKWWRLLSIFSLLFLSVIIVLLQTRSVWLGTLMLMVSFSIISLIGVYKYKTFQFSFFGKKSLIYFSIAITVLTFLFLYGSGTFKIFEYQTQTIFDIQSDNNQGRIKMWRSTLQMANDNLLLGTGAGNWKIEILPYYSLNHGERLQNWRRPHNDFLWILSEKGIFALIGYLAIIVFVVFYCSKILFQKKNKENDTIIALMLSGIFGYLVIAFFTFPIERINHQIYLTFMISVILSVYHNSFNIKHKIPTITKYRIPALIITTLIFGFSIFYASKSVHSEYFVKKTYGSKNENKWREMIINADIAFTPYNTLDPISNPIHLFRGVANYKLRRYNQALNDFKTAYKYHPTHVSVLNNLGSLYDLEGDYQNSIKIINRTLELYPNYEPAILNLAKVYSKKNKKVEAYITLLRLNTKSTNQDYLRRMNILKKDINLD